MSRVLGWHNQAPEGRRGLLYSCAWCIAGLWIRLGTLHGSFCSCYTKKTYENWSWKLHFRVSRLSVNSSMIRKKGEVKPVFLQLVLGAVRSKWAHKPRRKAGGTMLHTWGCAAPAALSWPSVPNCTFFQKNTAKSLCSCVRAFPEEPSNVGQVDDVGSALWRSLGLHTRHWQETQPCPELWIKRFHLHSKGLGLWGKCNLKTAWIVRGKILPYMQEIPVFWKDWGAPAKSCVLKIISNLIIQSLTGPCKTHVPQANKGAKKEASRNVFLELCYWSAALAGFGSALPPENKNLETGSYPLENRKRNKILLFFLCVYHLEITEKVRTGENKNITDGWTVS